MSRCMHDSSGFMGLTLTSLGLFIASVLLLLMVCSVVAYSDWQRIEELHTVAHDISARIQDMDAAFYEHSTLCQYPLRQYEFTIEASAEYITVSAKGSFGGFISVKERFVVRPWSRNTTMNWTTGNQLHDYLNATYGHQATPQDPLLSINVAEFEHDWENTSSLLALHPVVFQPDFPLTVEKVILVDESGEQLAFVLLYQTR